MEAGKHLIIANIQLQSTLIKLKQNLDLSNNYYGILK